MKLLRHWRVKKNYKAMDQVQLVHRIVADPIRSVSLDDFQAIFFFRTKGARRD